MYCAINEFTIFVLLMNSQSCWKLRRTSKLIEKIEMAYKDIKFMGNEHYGETIPSASQRRIKSQYCNCCMIWNQLLQYAELSSQMAINIFVDLTP